ncbi:MULTISPECIES: hypothetical protein [unclassified Uliginosibacterium]|uniref:hypothetical protein n=1 Tax=unclassified Uliginosibacterium TaxID=2621521 RepID=UPI000C7B13DC|nr:MULTISPECIES: hypothetical protein [unclassified Uliginosibacterium]MDO6387511.1 hypothetical protein [Uliginosibacterium sp. 31-12]PLK47438.1 hypothetical protein C0V76_17450 [Uliginosibacterium sp. TH139]
MLPIRYLLVCLALLSLLGGCATTQFYPHEARENLHEGKGGSRFTVEGIDVWFNGEPPRKYAILGYIDDPRGLLADDNHRSIDSAVLAKAREIGANALIEVPIPTRAAPSSSIMVGGGSGYYGGGFYGMGMGVGVPLSDRQSVKYTALKYLD